MHDHDDNPGSRAPDGDGADNEDANDLPAFALGALDDDALEGVLRRLQESSETRDELAALEELVGSLGLAASPSTPPPDLRERVLAATFQEPPAPVTTHRDVRRAPVGWMASAAALLVIGVLGVFGFNQWTTAGDRADTIDRLEATAEFQDQRIAELRTIARGAGVWVDFEQPLIWTSLEMTVDDEEASGFLCRTPDGETAYLVIIGMPLEPNEVLQAWLIEGSPVSAGTFRTDAAGRGFLILRHEGGSIQDFDLIGVTIEPPGGSPQPTSEPVMTAEIT